MLENPKIVDRAPNQTEAPNYEDLLALVVEREDAVLAFDAFIKRETAWIEAPASTRFHLAKPGGLVEHSINVVRILLKLRDQLASDLSQESCVIVGLYHDLGKAGVPGKPYYLVNPGNSWQRERFPYIINKELVQMDHATRSLFLLASHVPITEEEAQAIRYHDGQYVEENRCVAGGEIRLSRLLHFADCWAGWVVEREENQ